MDYKKLRKNSVAILLMILMGWLDYKRNLSNLCSAIEKNIFNEIMHFHYMICGHALAQ